MLASIVACSMVLVGAVAASAVTRAEVALGLGLDRTSADYVLLVDNSESMRDKGFLGPVRGALNSLLQALKPQDHLTVVLFSKEPNVTWNDAVGTDLPAIKRALRRPTGARTDIGSAIGQALDVLERSRASSVARVVMLTDGGHHPAPGSAYRGDTGRPWNALAARVRKLPASRNIEAYSYALTPAADARLLRQVFGDRTTILSTPVAQLSNTFRDQVAGQVEHAETLVAIRNDADAGVRIDWPSELTDLDLAAGAETVDMRLVSTASRVPIAVSGLAVTSRGMHVTASGLPSRLVLKPRQVVNVRVRLSFDGTRRWLRTATESGALTASAQLGSPWDGVLADDLRVEPPKPHLVRPVAAIRATASPRIPVKPVLIALLLLLVIGGLVLWRKRAADTPMDGTLQIQGIDGDVVSHQLGVLGRRVEVGPKAGIHLGESRGRLVGRTSVHDGESVSSVELQLRSGFARTTKHRFIDGQDRLVGGHTLTYWA